VTWTLTNLIIQIIAGVLGAHAAAHGVKEHSFGAVGHTVAGAVAGGLTGSLLQTLVGTVTSTGITVEPTAVEQTILQALTGATAGAVAMLIIGFLKHPIDQRKSADD